MVHIYAIRSLKNGRMYVGITERDPKQRLSEHNDGKTESNLMNRPFELVYVELMESMDLALKRERFLKSGKGRSILKSLIVNWQASRVI